MRNYNNSKDIFEKSIVLIGPVGVGKSLISEELGRKQKMPVITTDLLRHCPSTIEEIDKRITYLKNKIDEIKQKITISDSNAEKEKATHELDKISNDLWVCIRQREMRTLFPNVLNYEQMGYNVKVSQFLEEKFGKIAWHFYQKQFENQLLKQIVEQIDCPCIIDMGGGMCVCPIEEYKKLDKIFRKLDPELYKKHFDLSKISFSHIEVCLSKFKNVIELQLTKDYELLTKKARENKLNEIFVATKQYSKLATKSIQTAGLISNNEINQRKFKEIINNILNNNLKT